MKDKTYEEQVKEMLNAPADVKEPFCPFWGAYCNEAYSETCLICKDGKAAYKDLNTFLKENNFI